MRQTQGGTVNSEDTCHQVASLMPCGREPAGGQCNMLPGCRQFSRAILWFVRHMLVWVWEGITQAAHTRECHQDSCTDDASLLLTAC